MRVGINKKIGDTDIYEHKEGQTGLTIDMYNLFGTTQIAVGTKDNSVIPATTIARLIYDLRQKNYRHAIVPIELCTGGPSDNVLSGAKKNWFPGSETYGIFLVHDAPMFDNERGEGAPIRVILRKGSYSTVDQSVVKILDVLDGVNTNPTWIAKMKIFYYIETSDGQRGFVNARLIDKIVYKASA